MALVFPRKYLTIWVLVEITDLWVVMSMLHEKYVSSFQKPLKKSQITMSLVVMSILGLFTSFFFIIQGGFLHILGSSKSVQRCDFDSRIPTARHSRVHLWVQKVF
ncbi:hypothetical protein COOONC_10279, partial [Cooperia oncophora]